MNKSNQLKHIVLKFIIIKNTWWYLKYYKIFILITIIYRHTQSLIFIVWYSTYENCTFLYLYLSFKLFPNGFCIFIA